MSIFDKSTFAHFSSNCIINWIEYVIYAYLSFKVGFIESILIFDKAIDQKLSNSELVPLFEHKSFLAQDSFVIFSPFSQRMISSYSRNLELWVLSLFKNWAVSYRQNWAKPSSHPTSTVHRWSRGFGTPTKAQTFFPA